MAIYCLNHMRTQCVLLRVCISERRKNSSKSFYTRPRIFVIHAFVTGHIIFTPRIFGPRDKKARGLTFISRSLSFNVRHSRKTGKNIMFLVKAVVLVYFFLLLKPLYPPSEEQWLVRFLCSSNLLYSLSRSVSHPSEICYNNRVNNKEGFYSFLSSSLGSGREDFLFGLAIQQRGTACESDLFAHT